MKNKEAREQEAIEDKMESKEKILNQVGNCRKVMEKVRSGGKLSKEDRETIVQFYLEVNAIAYELD